MFELNTTLIAQIINFFLLLFILAKFAWKPLINIIDERRDKIAQDLDKAEQERGSAEALRVEYEQQLHQARLEAQQIMEKALRQAEQAKQELLEAARAEHERLLTATREQIVQERQLALEQIRQEVVGLSVAVAGKVIGQSIDSSVNAKLVNDFIDELEQKKQRGLLC